MAIEIVDFPLKMVDLSIVMLVYQRVTIRVEESTSKMCHSNALDLFESSGVSTCSAWLIMTKVGPFIEPRERCAGMK